jgi:hypothetical protein
VSQTKRSVTTQNETKRNQIKPNEANGSASGEERGRHGGHSQNVSQTKRSVMTQNETKSNQTKQMAVH